MNTTRAISAAAQLGESPVWDAAEQWLYYVDIDGRRLHRCRLDGSAARHWDFDSEPGACALHADGGLVLAMRDGLWRFDPDHSAAGAASRTPLAAPPYDPRHERFNDARCDPWGRLWVGTIYEPRRPPLASLYRWSAAGLQRLAGGITVSNGLAFSPDRRVAHWADTTSHTIFRFALDADGQPGAPQVWCRFPNKDECRQAGQPYGGRPDGAAFDNAGRYWVAMYEGARLLCLDAQAQVVDERRLPVQCPTMPCFGGRDGRTLFVTSASQGRPAEERATQPWAGCVLALEVEVGGPAADAVR